MSEAKVASSNSHKRLIGAICLLAFLVLWFVSGRLHYVFDFSEGSYSPYFWPRRMGLLLHLTGGFVAIICGLVQLWLGFSGKTSGLHRYLGKLYVAAVVFGALGAAYLVSTIPGHFAYASGLAGMAAASLVTTGMAVVAIRRRNIAQHQTWMIRSYAVIFAFVTYRLGGALGRRLVPLPDDPVATDFDTMLAWASWAIPLLVAEVCIQLKAMSRSIGFANCIVAPAIWRSFI